MAARLRTRRKVSPLSSGSKRRAIEPFEDDASPSSGPDSAVIAVTELFAEAIEVDVLRRYAVGERVLSAIETRGRRAVNKIALRLDCSPKVLYQHTLVCRCFASDEIRRWVRRRNAHGQPPSWTHFLVFCRVRSKARREVLFEEWLRSPAGIRELAARIRASAAPDRRAPARSPTMEA
jgi:hypothetical protein